MPYPNALAQANPRRNLLAAQMLPSTGEGSYLRQQFPQVYGFLGGLAGTAPDEMQGSAMDPTTAAVRQGASYGYLPGLVASSAPLGKAGAGLGMLTGMARGTGKAEEALAAVRGAQQFDNSALMGGKAIGSFDPRFDNRALEQARLSSTVPNVVPTQGAAKPTVSLADFEGRPFITSMSDRTAAGGNLVGINDVAFNRPVELKGGQDFMFNNPGQVWASAQNPVNAIMKGANEIKSATGQNPLFLPWRMAPTGGDFAAMTGETMLAYADSAMNKTQKRLLDKSIKQYIPEWSGVSDPASVEQFRTAPDKVRKALKGMMDVNFRNEGGLNIGQARLAVADPAQLVAPDAGVMNVGEIYAGSPTVMQSGHPSYPRGVPGQGLGALAENRNIFELMPEVARARGIANPTQPGQTDIRALQMKPYAGIIDNALLKRLGY